MPAGQIYFPGQNYTLPGVRFRIENIGEAALVPGETGVVAVVARAAWGPLGSGKLLSSIYEVNDAFGTGLGTDAIREAFRGRARYVLVQRVGSGGTVATKTLVDTTGSPVNVARIDARYPGVRGNAITLQLRNSLTNPSGERELLVSEGTTLLQTIPFASGAAEPTNLVNAVTAANSPWVVATKLADGNGTMATVSAGTPLTGGANPTTAGDDYTAALAALETQDWDWLVVDTSDTSIQASVATYIDTVRNNGKFVKAVLGEPTSVSLATRQTNAKAFNDPPIVYVANGFTTADGTVEGYLAAARVAGMITATPITVSMTRAVVPGATGVVGGMASADAETSLKSGCVVFGLNSARQVIIEAGLTTYVTLNANEDAGWQKIRRLRTRDSLMTRIALAWDQAVGQLNNDPGGRGVLVTYASLIVDDMIREGALASGVIAVDAANPPTGDAAYFTIEVSDLDSLEKVFMRFGFRFNPVATL